MEKSNPPKQEVVGDQITEEISKIKQISLGAGAAACQVCGSSFHEGDAVTVYVFRPAGEVMFQVGFVVCGDSQHEPPKEFTLGVRELLVEGRVGWCSDVVTQSSWPVLLAPEVLAVSEASTKSVREVPSGDCASVDVAVSSDDGEEERSSVKMSVGEARRRAAQRWLLESRPRDAHNVLDVQQYGGRQVFAEECWFGKPERQRNRRRSIQWYVQAYLHDGGGDDVVPVSEDVLDGVRVGGGRNYGFGELSVADTQTVTLENLEYSRLAGAEAFELELVSPYVLSTEHPGADEQGVPWWWDASGAEVRRRETRLVAGDEEYVLGVVDHGQRVSYTGGDPVETAVNGVLRVGSHAKFGFGEFRVRPATGDRVGECVTASGGDRSARDEASVGGDAER